MSFEKNVVAYLRAALSAKVQNKIYPVVLPDKCVAPAIRYIMLDPEDTSSLDGFGSLEMCRFQFDVYSKDYAEAAEIAETLKASLDGKGSYESRLPDYEQETRLYIVTQDFILYSDKFI